MWAFQCVLLSKNAECAVGISHLFQKKWRAWIKLASQLKGRILWEHRVQGVRVERDVRFFLGEYYT